MVWLILLSGVGLLVYNRVKDTEQNGNKGTRRIAPIRRDRPILFFEKGIMEIRQIEDKKEEGQAKLFLNDGYGQQLTHSIRTADILETDTAQSLAGFDRPIRADRLYCIKLAGLPIHVLQMKADKLVEESFKKEMTKDKIREVATKIMEEMLLKVESLDNQISRLKNSNNQLNSENNYLKSNSSKTVKDTLNYVKNTASDRRAEERRYQKGGN